MPEAETKQLGHGAEEPPGETVYCRYSWKTVLADAVTLG